MIVEVLHAEEVTGLSLLRPDETFGFLPIGPFVRDLQLFRATIQVPEGTLNGTWVVREFGVRDAIAEEYRFIQPNAAFGLPPCPDFQNIGVFYCSAISLEVSGFFDVVAASPPEAAIVSAIDGNGEPVAGNGATLSDSLTLFFTATGSGTINVACRVDAGPATPCASPQVVAGLSVGPHVFDVVVTDGIGNEATASFSWTIQTPAQATEQLVTDVQDLVDTGVINADQGTSLVMKLEAVLARLDRGQDTAAVNQLRAMRNQIDGFVAGGALTPVEAQALIDAIEAISLTIQQG